MFSNLKCRKKIIMMKNNTIVIIVAWEKRFISKYNKEQLLKFVQKYFLKDETF